jgi:hypothetical protein
MSVAGPSAAYEYFARSASGKVAAVRATSPSPAEVVIAILSSDGDGTPSAELIATVQAAVNDEDTRPLGDRVTVQGAEIIEYAIDATLYLYPGRSQSRSLTPRWPRCKPFLRMPIKKSAAMWCAPPFRRRCMFRGTARGDQLPGKRSADR